MTTRRYAPEHRRQMVELVRTGRTAEELSREFGCHHPIRLDTPPFDHSSDRPSVLAILKPQSL